MDEKTLQLLEFNKVRDRLAAYAAFSASAALARDLHPLTDVKNIQERQAITSEARLLLSINDSIGLGGARDIRPQVDLAAHGGVLSASELLDVKNTLGSARDLSRSFERQKETYPNLSAIIERLQPPPGMVDAISHAISERGDVLDSASDRLANIRRELKTSHERLLSRLERLINDPNTAPMMQEGIITQRNGRYVIPLRAEFKGRIRSIVHDQSSSGATLFIEPLAVVEMNNQWHELQLAERDEERRILAELSGQVGMQAGALTELVNALADFDLALMCARYADDLHAVEPILQAIGNGKDKHPGSVLRLLEARHPLLDPQKVQSIDVDLDPQTYAVIITGPNTGGKTVTLKTVGLLCLMAQCGLHIPAQSGSVLSVFHNIYADIGDEQSIEQSLSTFSGHITNIIRILRRVDRYKLVLLDELGAGTDPQEGAALARAIVDYLVEHSITCLVATHYPELKTYAHSKAGVTNASMEFNLKTLLPTYRLTIGLPGRSNALLIAQRLGLPDDVIQSARGTLDPNELKADDMLDEIHRQRLLARRARGDADRAHYQAEKLRKELEIKLEKLEEEKLTILEQARQQAQERIEILEEELNEMRRAMQRAHLPLSELKPVLEQAEALKNEVEKPVVRRRSPKQQRSVLQPLRVGQKIRVRSLKTEAVITALDDESVEVQIGGLRMRTGVEDIQRHSDPEEETPPTPASTPSRPAGASTARPAAARTTGVTASPGIELDLRGQRAEEALELLERHLESAYVAGLPFVRVIHGKGTGKLRQAVRDAVRLSGHVSRWENGHDNEGGDGVTVVFISE
ncbi:MAG: endonuclease MutS2 [Anaerolineae bacterium]|nr:endonuclease MutS2 [Anaerolineae bacterium]